MRCGWLLLLLIAPALLPGCRDGTPSGEPAPPSREAAPPEDFSTHFELRTETVLDHHWATIRRITIRGEGRRAIALGSSTGGLVDLSPDPQPTNEIFLIAVVDPGTRSFTWWTTDYTLEDGRRVSGGAGAPRTFPVKRDQPGRSEVYIQEIIHLNDVSGRHAYGRPIELGHFLTEIPHAPGLTLVIR